MECYGGEVQGGVWAAVVVALIAGMVIVEDRNADTPGWWSMRPTPFMIRSTTPPFKGKDYGGNMA